MAQDFKNSGGIVASDKNDRFWPTGFGKRFMSSAQTEPSLISMALITGARQAQRDRLETDPPSGS